MQRLHIGGYFILLKPLFSKLDRATNYCYYGFNSKFKRENGSGLNFHFKTKFELPTTSNTHK